MSDSPKNMVTKWGLIVSSIGTFITLLVCGVAFMKFLYSNNERISILEVKMEHSYSELNAIRSDVIESNLALIRAIEKLELHQTSAINAVEKRLSKDIDKLSNRLE